MKDSTLWILQMFTGVGLVALLGLHMGAQHLNDVLSLTPEGVKPTEWVEVVARASTASHKILYLGLLLFGLYHGAYGLSVIIGEAGLGRRGYRVASALVFLVTAAFFVYGAYAVLTGTPTT